MNPKEKREYIKKYQEENKEKIREYKYNYYLKNKEKIRLKNLKTMYKNICKRCNKPSFGYLCIRCFRKRKGSLVIFNFIFLKFFSFPS